MRTPLIAGNWKMNGSKPMVRELVSGILAGLDPDRRAELLLIPPYPYIPLVSSLVEATPVWLGGQDLSTHASGAYTGEVAGSMLSDLGCAYVLVGHSERRSLHAEDNATVAAKFVAAQTAGLQPILCVGETLEERDAGQTEAVVAAQIAAVIEAAGIAAF
jgi:triosephosphate isomerase